MALDLAYETVGSGPPLVVLHGLFGSRGNWRGIARALAARNTVHTVDLRNHGTSPWADSMGYDEMADDVLKLIQFLGLERSTLMGHSMGGKVAMAQAMSGADVMAAASRTEVQWHSLQAVPDGGVFPFLMQNLVPRNDHFEWRLNLMGSSASIHELIAFPDELMDLHFGQPVTVIAGEHSGYVAQRDGSSFRPMFSQVGVEIVPDAGHWVNADQPAVFVRPMRDALKHNAAWIP